MNEKNQKTYVFKSVIIYFIFSLLYLTYLDTWEAQTIIEHFPNVMIGLSSFFGSFITIFILLISIGHFIIVKINNKNKSIDSSEMNQETYVMKSLIAFFCFSFFKYKNRIWVVLIKIILSLSISAGVSINLIKVMIQDLSIVFIMNQDLNKLP